MFDKVVEKMLKKYVLDNARKFFDKLDLNQNQQKDFDEVLEKAHMIADAIIMASKKVDVQKAMQGVGEIMDGLKLMGEAVNVEAVKAELETVKPVVKDLTELGKLYVAEATKHLKAEAPKEPQE